jgi:inner membrane protein
MTESRQSYGIMERLRNSQLLRVGLISFLAALLLIPVGMIDGVITERQNRRSEAVSEVTSKWGDRQAIIGPMLVVPYLHKISEKDEKGVTRVRRELRNARFLPESVRTSGHLRCETRYRGIYKVPVYTADLDVSGIFSRPNLSLAGIDASEIKWDRAYLSVRISDARAIMNQVTLRWNEKQTPFLPGAGEFDARDSGIHVPLKDASAGDSNAFSFHLKLNGSEDLYFVPFGKETLVEIASNWTNPSFQGNWLPSERTINKDGFLAKWNIPYLGRNYPQQWTSEEGYDETIQASRFGIKCVTSLDQYSMAKRSTKYGILFILLTFITLWLFEITAKVRIHPIQYLLVGAGMCLFFLLEISIAEHIGFPLAYLIATLMISSLIYFYCRFVLGGFRRSAVIGTVVLLLYTYLYSLLMNQDYALLIGSICLFLVLAAVMFVTRKIDWYSHKVPSEESIDNLT